MPRLRWLVDRHLYSRAVIEEENTEVIQHLMPLDLYIEKKKMKIMPQYLKLFNEADRSICRLRRECYAQHNSYCFSRCLACTSQDLAGASRAGRRG